MPVLRITTGADYVRRAAYGIAAAGDRVVVRLLLDDSRVLELKWYPAPASGDQVGPFGLSP